MQVTVRLFGSVREATGEKERTVRLEDGASVADLRALLAREHAIFEEMGERLRVSVNMEIRPGSPVLADGDEVAFLPPVSGGQDPQCTLSDQPLDVGAVVKRVSGPDAGGIVTFIGAVRNASRGHDIEHLEYEAYAGMAEQEMDKICQEAAEKWPGSRVAVAHRVGHLEIGDLAVVVVAAAKHRAEAFDACRYTIDTLKDRVPIWKKEVATDGEYWVEDTP